MIKVIYHAALKRNAHDVKGIRNTAIKHQEGMTIKNISEILGLDEVGLVILNGTLTRENAIVKDGDCVEMHPFVGGG